MYNLDKIIEDCMIGEVSSSTSKELVKESLLQFGRECFDAGRKYEWFCDEVNQKYYDFDDFINSVDNG